MRGPPKLWTWTTTYWAPLPSRRAWTLWHALMRARWSTAVAWRERFLAFDAPDRVVSSAVVEDFLQEIASPQRLMDRTGSLPCPALERHAPAQIRRVYQSYFCYTGIL
jgi:hypothetical protein